MTSEQIKAIYEDAARIADYAGAIQHPADGSYAGSQPVMGRDVGDAIRARAEAVAADPGLIGVAPWQPPPEAERPEGYECLGRGVKGSSWHHIQWNNGKWWLRSPGVQAFGLNAFAPLPPAREGGE